MGVAMAIYSSMRGIPIASRAMVVMGEISLTGELRPISHLEKMLKEAEKMGFTRSVIPQKNKFKFDGIHMKCKGVDTLKDALEMLTLHN